MLTFFVVSAFIAQSWAQTGPTVTISQGTVIGTTIQDGNYMAFYGIPYAGNTGGSNRFKAPTAAPIFPGDFHAMDPSKVCAQPSAKGLVGTEDCLYLNIYTKNLTTPKPVLVWIDGEEYSTTNNNIQFYYRRLVDEGVLIISLNYRTSIFGFLCLGIDEAPGNAGLKDVIAGLEWIKANIAPFGGDPNNVILFGHGSGAAVVDLITLSPRAENLVHKAIASSGSSLAPWAVAYDPIGYAQILGAKLGSQTKSKAELAKLFLETDVNTLANAINSIQFLNNTPLFAPCIEDITVSLNSTVLSDAPINLLRSGNYNHIPFLTGYTDREGSIRAEEAAYDQWLEKSQANFADFIQADLTFASEKYKTSVAQTIKEFYFAAKPINMETIEDFLDYHGDTLFLVSIIRGARERALTSKVPVRLYEFSYRGTHNSDWPLHIPLTGAKHGSVLNYIFDFDLTVSDADVRDSLIKRWAAFCFTGVPTAAELSSPGATQWPDATSSLNYLYYAGGGTSTNITVVSEGSKDNPHQQRMTFWNDIYFKHYAAPRSVNAAGQLVSLLYVILLCQAVARFF